MYVLNLDNLGMNVAAGIRAECKEDILPGSLRRSGIYLGWLISPKLQWHRLCVWRVDSNSNYNFSVESQCDLLFITWQPFNSYVKKCSAMIIFSELEAVKRLLQIGSFIYQRSRREKITCCNSGARALEINA